MRKFNPFIGWIASFCFMFSALPSVIESLSTKQCNINIGTLILWTLGELCAIIYIMPKRDRPLMANYIVNLICLFILWYFKII